MAGNWRISSFNGALLAAYFIPAWTIAAFRIVASPIHGLYELPNISLALFVSDHLQLSGMETVRVALLLALGRLTVVAFLAAFLFFISRPSIREGGDGDEALGMALSIGSVMSFGVPEISLPRAGRLRGAVALASVPAVLGRPNS